MKSSIHLQVYDDDARVDRAQAGQTVSRSEVDLGMRYFQVAVELSELEDLDNDEALPQ